MHDWGYVAAGIGIAAAITFGLRLLPFVARIDARESGLLEELRRWMPLGAMAILAIFALSHIDVTSVHASAGPLAGVVVTVAVHLWRRNLMLSILLGTLACVAISNLW